MPYYTFRQNNSGGGFDVTDTLDVYVIIKANSAEEANDKLVLLGGYFDGCADGIDCPCCGDRWWPVFESDATQQPEIYSESDRSKWSDYKIHE